MTKTYLVQKKVEDLKMGDMFVHWVLNPDPDYKAKRILDIKVRNGSRILVLDDARKWGPFHNEELVLVEVLA